MLIVDSQVHIWAANTPERPWPVRPAQPHRAIPFSSDDLLVEMDRAGVDRVVIVPPTWEGERNDLALAAARAHPDRFAVMGRIDPFAPGARDLLPRWRDQKGMLGLRFHFARKEYEAPLTESRLGWLWSDAEELGLPVMMIVAPYQLPLVDRVAQDHPRLKLVMDHLAPNFGKKDEEAFPDIGLLLALAARPNVAVKASSMPTYTSDSYPYRKLHPLLKKVYDAFGRERLFWGTDMTKMPCSYRQAVTMFTEEIPWLSALDKEWIMGRGVCEWIGWKMP
jgi:L-fuconolactonase